MLQPSQDKNKLKITEETAKHREQYTLNGGKTQEIPEGVTAWKEGNPSVFVISGKKDVQGDE